MHTPGQVGWGIAVLFYSSMSESSALRLLGTRPPISPWAVLNRLIGLLPSVIRVDFSPSAPSIFTCISGPETAMARIVSAPIEVTMSLNLLVSMSAISLAFSSSRSFCSFRYFVSASLARVSLSSSDSWTKPTNQ